MRIVINLKALVQLIICCLLQLAVILMFTFGTLRATAEAAATALYAVSSFRHAYSPINDN